MKNAVINLSICLSDIPKDKIKVSERNGKAYLSVNIRPRKEADSFGNDIYAIVSQTKEQRDANEEKIYVGNGQYVQFTGNTPDDVNEMPPAPPEILDDLPF